MTDEIIIQLVKKLEPFFIGYTADRNTLKNSNGMELIFRLSWNNKTTVSGLHASRSHSIGCSFQKAPEKIFKDIRKRLMSDYYEDFFKHKREQQERERTKHENIEKLRAIASIANGEVCKNYGHSYYSGEFVSSHNLSVHQDYRGQYELKITLDYINTMSLVKYFIISGYINEKKEDKI